MVPQRRIPTWRTHAVRSPCTNGTRHFVLKSTIDPDIIVLVRFYLPFNFFVSECRSCKQTRFIIMMKTKKKGKRMAFLTV